MISLWLRNYLFITNFAAPLKDGRDILERIEVLGRKEFYPQAGGKIIGLYLGSEGH